MTLDPTIQREDEARAIQREGVAAVLAAIERAQSNDEARPFEEEEDDDPEVQAVVRADAEDLADECMNRIGTVVLTLKEELAAANAANAMLRDELARARHERAEFLKGLEQLLAVIR